MGMYEQISSNKLRSILIVFGFVIFLLILSWLFAEITGWGIFGLVIAAFIVILLSVGSYYWSDSIVLKISSARPATQKEFPHFYNVSEGLAIAAGIPMPKLYVINDTALNAFATGRDPKHAVICATTGLLSAMNRSELEGVVAHEMSHFKNYDIRFMTLVTVMVGITALLSDFLLRSFFWGSGNRERGKMDIVLLVVGIIFAILSPLIATLIQLAVSRQREYLADASSVELTRYPDGLISALRKLDKDTEPLEAANKATAHLYISNPLKGQKMWFKGLFATHPPIESRIAALQKM